MCNNIKYVHNLSRLYLSLELYKKHDKCMIN